MTTLSFQSNSSTARRIARFGLGVVALAVVAASIGAGQASGQDFVREGGKVTLNTTVPRERVGVTVDQNLGEQIPLGLPLIDSEGKPAKVGYFIDGRKPTIITLNYSDCPMLCNVQLNRLCQSLNKMDLKIGQDFNLLTVSIDPTESTQRIAKTKQKYVDELKDNQPGVADGWEFCTARQPIITKLADVLGFRYKYDRVNKQYNHPAMLAFVSPDGVISRYSLSLDFPPEQMRLALVDAGEGTVGSKVDQFILWCYSYDPDSNSYSLVAFRIMKVAGATTVFIMLACLMPFWIGRKGKPADPEASSDGDDDVDPNAGPNNENESHS